MAWDYDVIIVGAGPAGSSVALHLAQQAPELARRTAVFEKSRHPRHKLCAGALVVDTEVTLRKLGLDIEAVPHIKVPWVHAWFEGRGPKMRLDDHRAFRICQRTEFDQWLCTEARSRGVALHEDTKVQSIEPIPGGVEVRTGAATFRARAVIGADGAKSLVRRTVLGNSHEGGARVARTLEILTECPAVAPLHQLADDATIDLEVLIDGVQGYVWDFPAERQGQRRRNRGIYDSRTVPRLTATPLLPVLDSELEKAGQHLADYEVLGAPVRWYDERGPFAIPHVMLVGDAAGTDALFGEGISSALAYGELAATSLRQAFASGDYTFADYPARIRRSAMGRALRRRTRTAQLMFRLRNPALQRLIWWRLGPIARWYIVKFVFNWAR